MKRTIALICMLLVSAHAARGNPVGDSKSETSPVIQDLVCPINAPEPRALDVVIRSVLADWRKVVELGQRNQAEYVAAYRSAKDEDDRKGIVVAHLERQRRLVERLVEDCEFVRERIGDSSTKMSSLIKEANHNRDKAASAAPVAVSEALCGLADMEAIHREWRQLPARPDVGSDAYGDWHRRTIDIQIRFTRARAIALGGPRKGVVYGEIARRLAAETERLEKLVTFLFALSNQLAELTAKGRDALQQLDTNDPDASIKVIQAFADEINRLPVSEDMFSTTVIADLPPPPLTFVDWPKLEDFDIVAVLRRLADDFGGKLADGGKGR